MYECVHKRYVGRKVVLTKELGVGAELRESKAVEGEEGMGIEGWGAVKNHKSEWWGLDAGA